jgi:hypothetical protein
LTNGKKGMKNNEKNVLHFQRVTVHSTDTDVKQKGVKNFEFLADSILIQASPNLTTYFEPAPLPINLMNFLGKII